MDFGLVLSCSQERQVVETRGSGQLSAKRGPIPSLGAQGCRLRSTTTTVAKTARAYAHSNPPFRPKLSMLAPLRDGVAGALVRTSRSTVRHSRFGERDKFANSRFPMTSTPGTAGSEPLKLSERARFLLATPQPGCDDRAFEDYVNTTLARLHASPGWTPSSRSLR